MAVSTNYGTGRRKTSKARVFLKPGKGRILINGLGYVAGAVVGYLFIYLFGRLGLASWLFGLVDEQQTFLQILAIPLIAWFLLAG